MASNPVSMRTSYVHLLLTLALLICGSIDCRAGETLKIATNGDVTALDPHFANIDLNMSITRHMYQMLYDMDENMQLIPGLASSTRQVDATSWEISIRKDIRFHSGAPLTANDVICTMERVRDFGPVASNGGFADHVKFVDFAKTHVDDPYRLTIVTTRPFPILMNSLAMLAIMSCREAREAQEIVKSQGRDAVLKAFASGALLNGTGPFKFSSFISTGNPLAASELRLERNEEFWAQKPQWKTVLVYPIVDEGKRLNALKSGDVDVISHVPASTVAELKSTGHGIFQTNSSRMIHLHLYHTPDGRESKENHVPLKRKDGQRLPNPFSCLQVRAAFSKAIDRAKLVKIMEGAASPAGQLMPPGMSGYIESLAPDAFAPRQARKLWQEAAKACRMPFLSEPGLQLSIHGPNDRYPNDGKILAAIAKMWTETFPNLTVTAQSMPKARYFQIARELLVGLLGWGVDTGLPSSPLRALVASSGTYNLGNFVKSAVDQIFENGLSAANPEDSLRLMKQATQLAIHEYAVVPLYYQINIWGTRGGLKYVPRKDEFTLAQQIRNQ